MFKATLATQLHDKSKHLPRPQARLDFVGDWYRSAWWLGREMQSRVQQAHNSMRAVLKQGGTPGGEAEQTQCALMWH